jgi:predicted small secreted protein
MKNFILIAITMMLPLTVAACNTVKGMGKDIQGGATAVQNAMR